MYHHPNLIDLPDAHFAPRTFETSKTQTYTLLVVGLVMLAIGVVEFDSWYRGELHGKAAFIPFLMLPVGLVVAGLQLWNLCNPLTVTLSPAGFRVGDDEYPWDAVTAVNEQLNLTDGLNGLTVWVRRADGRTARFSSFRLAQLPGLLAVIHHHTQARLADEARAAVDRGEAVRFGPIELNATGLRAKDRAVPWDEVEHVTPDGAGDLGVWVTGRKSAWLDIETGKVDNVRVFLQLCEKYTARPAAKAGGFRMS